MALRILHLHDKPPGSGGLRRHVDDLIAMAPGAGWDAEALEINADASRPAAAGMLPRTYAPSLSGGAARQVLAAIEAARPDIVHLHAGFTAMAREVVAAIDARWPTVGTLHDVAPFCLNGRRLATGTERPCTSLCGSACITTGCTAGRGLVGTLAHATIKRGLRQAWLGLDALVVPSGYMRSLAIAHGASAQAVTLIPHPIAMPSAAPVPVGPPMILFVGNLTRDKGADLVVDALCEIAGLAWTACLVGDGPLRSVLEQRIEAAGLAERVTFTGRLGPDAVASLRIRSAFAVMPSRIMESYGLAGLESLAAGRAVVAAGRGGVTQWLRHGVDGLAFDPDTTASLAVTMASLLRSPDRLVAMGEAGRLRAGDAFSPAGFAARLGVVYARTLAGRRQHQRRA